MNIKRSKQLLFLLRTILLSTLFSSTHPIDLFANLLRVPQSMSMPSIQISITFPSFYPVCPITNFSAMLLRFYSTISLSVSHHILPSSPLSIFPSGIRCRETKSRVDNAFSHIYFHIPPFKSTALEASTLPCQKPCFSKPRERLTISD